MHAVIAIDAQDTALDLARNPNGPAQIVRPDRAAQPVRRVIHFLDQLLLRIERPDARHRPKDFLAPNFVLNLWFADHCGLKVRPFLKGTSSAVSNLAPRAARARDVLFNRRALW